MSHRIDIYKNATEPYNGLLAINAHLKKSVLPADLVELVFLRVSLINGCAYCIDKHSRDLLKSGMSIDKLVLVPVWYEAGELFFTFWWPTCGVSVRPYQGSSKVALTSR